MLRIPVEIFPITLLLVILNGSYFRIARWLLTIALTILLLLKLADIGTYSAFSRPFNPIVDGKLLVDGWIVLNGSVGPTNAYALVIAALLCIVFVISLLFWSFGAFRKADTGRWPLILGTGLGIASLGAIAVVHTNHGSGFLEASATSFVTDRVTLLRRSLADRQLFENLLANDPIDAIPPGRRLNALNGKDVILVFIESYGESALHDPRYAGVIGSRLEKVERQLHEAGLSSRSSWLVSPTSGGLSWLAHGTLLSGVWVDSQQRYDQLIASDRPSLNRLFREAGWRSVAVMPAITMDWPEASYFGYDAIHAANNLGYRGKPFNWVTMPDQYTLSAFQLSERNQLHRPIMAEIALISSHAPWTPIPRLLDWSTIDDGIVFNEQATSGDPPDVVWRDQDRIRAQYLASIDYVLEVLGSYMARYGRNAVFILLGDHQPANIITGPGASRAVPVHIVTDNPDLLGRLDVTRWTPGMIPGQTQQPERMDKFREELVRRFSDPH
ncbi:sulfatase [Phyllobacterium lublinensis]|uniref:sulfatase n=1 Tax=Phyllobacterium lublinensis TaxID=2875708 RepID=UPI001CCE157B|nr:sulfatase [Phyllobacterium sp. 2063]MBZ9655452.1 sulfatase [Phyllobacterium sp. 2063]